MKLILPKTLKQFLYKTLLNYIFSIKRIVIFSGMKIKVLFAAILIMVACKQKEQTIKAEVGGVGQEQEADVNKSQGDLEVYDFTGFEKFLNHKDGKVYVLNFWATWCAPCVKELPYFEKLHTEYANKNVEVILVSLDFPHLYEKKLIPFIEKNNLQAQVVALDDPDMNSWIPKVSEKWSGSIPATLIYKGDKRAFYEQSFNYEELTQVLQQFLNQ